jgi:hypothetical protein
MAATTTRIPNPKAIFTDSFILCIMILSPSRVSICEMITLLQRSSIGKYEIASIGLIVMQARGGIQQK